MRAEIFKEAAKRIESEQARSCCQAIIQETELFFGREKTFFREIFDYKRDDMSSPWFWSEHATMRQFNLNLTQAGKFNQSCRVLALLFCYEMTKNPVK